MKQKILIISYSYPPSNAPAAQRPYSFAKFLDKSKYDVTVLTCSNQDSSLGFNENFDIQLPDVKLLHVKSMVGSAIGSSLRESTMAHKKSSASKIKSGTLRFLSSLVIPDRAIFWANNAYKSIDPHQFDTIITTSPAFTNHIVGYLLKKKNRKLNWIADIRDYHYIENLSHQSGIKSNLNKRLEKTVLKNADRIVFISNAMKEFYVKHYNFLKEKASVIYNGFDLSEFNTENNPKKKSDKLTIFYAGSFYKGVRSPIPLFKILDACLEKNALSLEEFEVRIAGNLESELLEDIKRFKSSESLVLLGNISRKSVLQMLSECNLLWMIVGNKVAHYSGVPIKLYEYMASKTPILNFAPHNSEPTNIISKYNLGWSIDSAQDSLESQVNTLCDIIAKFRENDLQVKSSDKAMSEFTRENQTKILQEIL